MFGIQSSSSFKINFHELIIVLLKSHEVIVITVAATEFLNLVISRLTAFEKWLVLRKQSPNAKKSPVLSFLYC